jgi:tRNA(Ile2) C34 agmatinyltransferase TiaS
MLRKFQILYEWTRQFIVTRFSQESPQRSPKKKFDILGSTQQAPIVQLTETRSTSRLKNITQTRPKICPRCRTSDNSRLGNITKLDNGSWKCKTCDHTWRS